MEHIDRLQQQVDKNQTKLNQLENTVSSMCSSCQERHRIDLISKIRILTAGENSLKQTTEKDKKRIQQDIKQDRDKLDEYKGKYLEVSAEFNQMKNRILSLQGKLQKKQNFKDQIFAAVIIFLLLQVLALVIANSFPFLFKNTIEIDKAEIIQQVQK